MKAAGTGLIPEACVLDGGLAINTALERPERIAVDSAGNIYSPDGHANVVRKVTASTGFIATFAGMRTQRSSGDNGPAVNAELNSPMGWRWTPRQGLHRR